MTNENHSNSNLIIRLIRQMKGLKQAEAANRLDITQQAYSKIERNKKVTKTKLEKIVIAFECTQEDLEKIKGFLPPPRN